jgi:type IV pilus biogenesis protein CpaD/CtpE
MTTPLRRTLLCLALALPIAGCAVYEPMPVASTRPASFDRSWNAALEAAQDVGISVSRAERSSGLITGRRYAADVFISVLPQPDGSLRIVFDAKNLGPQDQGLNAAFTQAYNRRMGR